MVYIFLAVGTAELNGLCFPYQLIVTSFKDEVVEI